MQKHAPDQQLFEKEIKKEFYKYLLRSFPETILWEDELVVKDYLKTTIIDKIVRYNLPEKFRNINRNLLDTLLELFYKQPGYYLNYDNLSRSLRISKNTLHKHLFYLEFCYLIRIIKNFRPATLSTSRKLQRVYPYWWTLGYCYGEDMDKIIENFVLSYIDGTYYWKDSTKEIDIIQTENKHILPIEVKNKEQIEEKDIHALKFFMEKFNLKRAKLIYLGAKKTISFGERNIDMLPLWEFSLNPTNP